jgi:hypothetical protein
MEDYCAFPNLLARDASARKLDAGSLSHNRRLLNRHPSVYQYINGKTNKDRHEKASKQHAL